MDDMASTIECDVVGMYSAHPSPSSREKLAFAARRMALRLYCCGIVEDDYRGKAILDAGCGTGEYACWFASRGGHVTGIDLSDGSLQEAREYAEAASLEVVHFEKRSVLRTGFPDASFDFIYCTGVLHHTADPFGGLAELCRVLRPGGKILISLYNSLAFLPREARRRVARWLGGEDIDQRVLWGRRCFPFIARRLMKGARNDPQSALYDYFAIPHESLHSIGEVLTWFDRLGLEYLGSFPPARLDDYPAMFAAEAYKSVELELQTRMRFTLARVGSTKMLRRRRPGVLSQSLVQIMWLLFGVGIFSVAGLKPLDRFVDVQPHAPRSSR